MTDAPKDPASGSDTPESFSENEARLNTASDGTPATEAQNETTPVDVSSGDLSNPAASRAATEEQFYAPTATQPLDPTLHTTAAPSTAKRSNTVGLVAALAVGALVGGVSGAGVAAWAITSNQGSQVTSSTSTPQNITVNDTESVNVITAVAAKAGPSVVTISVSSKSAAGTGSGVVLSKDGYVLTNTHVVTLDGEIADPAVKVTTSDGHLYDATVVGTDPIADLAVIKLKNASNLTPADFADSSKLNVGATAIAIGAPLGLANTVTDGIVSALNRSISIASSAAPKSGSGDSSSPNTSPFDFWNFDNGQGNGNGNSQAPATAAATISLPVIQTDAAINPGNSGGALLDSNAKVIGINVAIASASGSSSTSGNIGVGFAIPSNLAQRVANEIIKNGKATHGLLGASVTDVSSTDTSAVVGAVIKQVTGGGAADKAGLQAGDVITQFDGVAITSSTDLTAQVRFLPAGATTDLTYVRGGKTSNATVTLGALG
ncbi:S1C family serine protease [Lacisediminihabitans profunda]|uniref:PDZ domain-containing protein n=1 Tax=Lacisediminihabitans profunda TaxID=2594790 RepID=A0A5C8USP4_9MICO|nr:trypsin-like peptidase domain-containing protein [Lacisediminihabitans profunda]TXN31277.1 PDZ domain-containing protein [Lacisediminihabitans profunda]